MHRQSAPLVLLLITVIALAACGGGGLRTEVRGSGTLTTQTRGVSGFDRILVSGPGVVHVAITGTESLEVQAEDNILGALTIEVVDGRLELGHEAHTNIVPTRDITYTITVAQLDGVSIGGSGELDVAALATSAFSVSISGSGAVTPSGRTGELSVEISGSGRYLGADLAADEAVVAVSGSGEAIVNATHSLTAAVSGSGSIRYLGDPVLDREISGSGFIAPFPATE